MDTCEVKEKSENLLKKLTLIGQSKFWAHCIELRNYLKTLICKFGGIHVNLGRFMLHDERNAFALFDDNRRYCG